MPDEDVAAGGSASSDLGTPWPLSRTAAPPAAPRRSAVPAAAAPIARVEPAGERDRLVLFLVLVTVLLLAAAAGLGAAALSKHHDHTDRDAWIAAALATGAVLMLSGAAALVRGARRT